MSANTTATRSVAELTDRVRRYYELVDSGDLVALVSLFSPDAIYCRPGYPPLVGSAQLMRFYAAERVIEKGRHNLVSVVADLVGVAVRGEFRGRLKNGQDVKLGFADFFTFNGELQFERRDTYFFAPMV